MVSFHKHSHLHQRAAPAAKANMENLQARDPEPQVLSVVLVTVTPTFSESVAGFTTISDDPSSETASVIVGEPAQVTSPSTTGDTSASSATGGFNFQSTTSSTPTPTPTPISTPATTSAAAITSAIASSTALFSATSSVDPFPAATSSASGSSSGVNSSTTQSGLSTGAKVGLAVGLIVLIGAVAAGALFFYGKKKRDESKYGKADNEKTSLGGVSTRPQMSSTAAAPRLSIRPMSRLLPEFGGGAKKRASQGNPLATFNEPANNNYNNSNYNNNNRNLGPSPPAASAWERRGDDRSTTPNNPFNDPPNPFADSNRAMPPQMSSAPSHINPAVAAGIAGTAAGASLAAMAASARDHDSKPSTPRIPSPTQTAASPAPMRDVAPLAPVADAYPAQPSPRSMANMAAVPAPLGTSGGPQPSVYRVLMDFKPSMNDELELRAGQLVRMAHEYDDGWALCVRLDRSQQGVAPRTCLAANPSKPRPPQGGPQGPAQGPPRGPMMRPNAGPNGRMSPAMNRPMSPAGHGPRSQSPRPASPQMRGPRPSTPNGGRNGPPGGRSMSPGPGAYNQAPRPLSPGPRPGQKRSMSPGPYGPGGYQKPMMPASQRQRSNSAGAAGRDRREFLGPSRLGPGMAM